MIKFLRFGLKNPRTTIAAVLAAVVAVLTAILYTIDLDPNTQADWNAVMVLLLAAFTALQGYFAKDAE